jgi:hypothetical protein
MKRQILLLAAGLTIVAGVTGVHAYAMPRHPAVESVGQGAPAFGVDRIELAAANDKSAPTLCTDQTKLPEGWTCKDGIAVRTYWWPQLPT